VKEKEERRERREERKRFLREFGRLRIPH
jgi:hypothetical protein